MALKYAMRIVGNALKLFSESDGGDLKGIDQILDLIRRTDSIAIRNEGTRVLVNLIKTLWMPPPSAASPVRTTLPDDPVLLAQRRNAFAAITTEEVADALGEMVGRNAKYPVLLNEGIMALTLLASLPAGGSFFPLLYFRSKVLMLSVWCSVACAFSTFLTAWT